MAQVFQLSVHCDTDYIVHTPLEQCCSTISTFEQFSNSIIEQIQCINDKPRSIDKSINTEVFDEHLLHSDGST